MTSFERPPAELRARLLGAARRTPATRPGAWRRRVLGALAFAGAWTALAAIILRPRFDWAALPAAPLLQTFSVLLAVVGAAAAAGLTRGRAMAGASTERLAATIGAGVAVLGALVLGVDVDGVSTLHFAGLAPHAVPCALIVVAVGLPLLGAALVPFAGLALGRPGFTGACVGLAAATLAHALVRFHCPIGGSGHALGGHLLPEIPLMLAGAWGARARVLERLLARRKEKN